MGPKYEFTGETIKYDGYILHQIRRLSDGKIGGWIESENNLSQECNCWVGDNAQVFGDAQVYDNALVLGNAHIYGNAKVFGSALVHDNAQVYGNASVDATAKVYGNAKVFGNAYISIKAEVYGDAKVFGCEIVSGKYHNDKEDSSTEVIQDFIYKVDDSNKLTAQTEYDSVEEFFSTQITNDTKLDTLVICAIDTKEPLIKLQKVEAENKTEFKFIVDITNEDGDSFTFKSIIKSQEQLNQLVQQTIDMLKQSPQFAKYVEDLAECL